MVGSLLAAGVGGILTADAAFAPVYPFLLSCLLGLGVLSTRELLSLLPATARPRAVPTTLAVLAVIAANWVPAAPRSPLEPVLFVFTGVVLAALLVEMATYRGPDGGAARAANATFAAAYLGVLPSFLIRVRFDLAAELSGLALATVIFVPKVCDIGAYLFGRVLGRHRFTPLLSPKKTWEGFAGGLFTSVSLSVGVNHFRPELFRHGIAHAIAFGLLVGFAGVMGDLAESLIKREGMTKDASKTIPGFGGVLDVIDSVLFAAPVAYLLLMI